MKKALIGLAAVVALGLGVVGYDYAMQANAAPGGLSVKEYVGGFDDRRAEARAMRALESLTLADLLPPAPAGWSRAPFDPEADPARIAAGAPVDGPSVFDWAPQGAVPEATPRRAAYTYRNGEAAVFFALAYYPAGDAPLVGPAAVAAKQASAPQPAGAAIFGNLENRLAEVGAPVSHPFAAAEAAADPQPWAILGGLEFWPVPGNSHVTLAAYEARLGDRFHVTIASAHGTEALVAVLAQFDVGTVNLKLPRPVEGLAPSAFYIDALAGLYD